jgi:four helix bundle protein
VGTVTGYRGLLVWQKAMDLVEACYQLSDKLPRSEEFGLRAQIRRAAVSIPSNIAEGQGRSATREYLRYLAIAHGSLMELETQAQVVGRLGYAPSADIDRILESSAEVGRMLNALITRLRARVRAQDAAT